MRSLGAALSEQGEYEEAESLLRHTLAESRELFGPHDSFTAGTRSLLRHTQMRRWHGETETSPGTPAGRLLERLRSFDRDDPREREALAWELLDPGRGERFPVLALFVAHEAVELSGGTAAGPMQALAEAAFQNGEPEEATACMERALRLDHEGSERDAAWMRSRIQAYAETLSSQ